MNAALLWLRTLIFPRRCCLCGSVTVWDQHICPFCRDKAPFILPPVCDRCGRSEDACVCRKKQHHYERCVAPLYYEGTVKEQILQYKQGGWKDTAEGFAVEMAEVIRREYGGIGFDIVTAVPQDAKARRERGFDPPAAVARRLSERIRAPYAETLTKLYETAPQKTLPAFRRAGNLLGVFDVTAPQAVDGKTVLLVDDITTTGATLDECAKMLRLFGAKEVYAVTMAAAVIREADEPPTGKDRTTE